MQQGQRGNSALAELAVRAGIADVDRVRAAKEHAQQHSRSFVESFAGSEDISESGLARLLSQELQIPRVSLKDCTPNGRSMTLLDAEFCRAELVFPIDVGSREGLEYVVIAMANPLNTQIIRDIHQRTSLRVEPLVAEASDVCEAIARVYQCAFEPLFGAAPVVHSSPDVTMPAPPPDSLNAVASVDQLLHQVMARLRQQAITPVQAREILLKCRDASSDLKTQILFSALLQLTEKGYLDAAQLLTDLSRGGR